MTHPDMPAPVPDSIGVHITNPEVLIPASLQKQHHDVTFRTIVLNAPPTGQDKVGFSIRPLCAADLSREYILVSAITNDVVLCETQSRAQDPANAVVGLPNPEGYLVKASTTTLAYPAVQIPNTDIIWVTAASFPAIVTVIMVNRVKG